MPRSILILTNRIPYPLHDGGALAMHAMIRGYRDSGWKVYLLAMNTIRHAVPAEKLQTLYADLEMFRTVDVDNTVSPWRILRNLLFSRAPEHADRFRSEAFASELTDMLQAVRPSVVQLESPFLGSYLPLIRKFAFSALVVYRMHNVEGQVWSRLAAEASGWKRLYLRSLATRILRYEQDLWASVDLLLPITRPDAEIVRAAGLRTPIEVAPFGISAADHPLPEWPAGPIMLYHIGAMDWLPNQEAMRWFLNEVWPELHRTLPELSFHFAGRNMPESFKAGLPGGAFCAGEVDAATAFVQDKHVLVVPLRSGSGIRVKILEAMSAGRLVISTDVGMQGIDAADQVHFLEARTVEDFVRTASWIVTHREEARGIAAAGHQLVKEVHARERIMARIIRRIDSLIGS